MSFLRKKARSASQPTGLAATAAPSASAAAATNTRRAQAASETLPGAPPAPASSPSQQQQQQQQQPSSIPLPKKSPSRSFSFRRSQRSSLPPQDGPSTDAADGGALDLEDKRQRRTSLKSIFTGSLGRKSGGGLPRERSQSIAALPNATAQVATSALGGAAPNGGSLGRQRVSSTPGEYVVPPYLRRGSTGPSALPTPSSQSAAASDPAASLSVTTKPAPSTVPSTPPRSPQRPVPAPIMPGSSAAVGFGSFAPGSPLLPPALTTAIPIPSSPSSAVARGLHSASENMSAHALLQQIARSPSTSANGSPSSIARRKSTGNGTHTYSPSAGLRSRAPSLPSTPPALGPVLATETPAMPVEDLNPGFIFGGRVNPSVAPIESYRLAPPSPDLASLTPSESGSVHAGTTPPANLALPVLAPEPVEELPVHSPQEGEPTKDSPTSPASAAATTAWWASTSPVIGEFPTPPSTDVTPPSGSSLAAPHAPARRPSASPTPSFAEFERGLTSAAGMDKISDEQPTFLDLPHGLKRPAEDELLLSTSPPKALRLHSPELPEAAELPGDDEDDDDELHAASDAAIGGDVATVDLSLTPPSGVHADLPPAVVQPESNNVTPSSRRTSSIHGGGSGDHLRLSSSSPVLYHLPARKQSHQFSKAELSELEASAPAAVATRNSAGGAGQQRISMVIAQDGANVFGSLGGATFRDADSEDTGSVTGDVLPEYDEGTPEEDVERFKTAMDEQSPALEDDPSVNAVEPRALAGDAAPPAEVLPADEPEQEDTERLSTSSEEERERLSLPAQILAAVRVHRRYGSVPPSAVSSAQTSPHLPERPLPMRDESFKETRLPPAPAPYEAVPLQLQQQALESSNSPPITPATELTFFSPANNATRASASRIRSSSQGKLAAGADADRSAPFLVLPSPLPKVVPHFPIPWSLLPPDFKRLAEREHVEIRPEDVRWAAGEAGKAVGFGLTVAKWSVGWWIIIPVRTARWALGV